MPNFRQRLELVNMVDEFGNLYQIPTVSSVNPDFDDVTGLSPDSLLDGDCENSIFNNNAGVSHTVWNNHITNNDETANVENTEQFNRRSSFIGDQFRETFFNWRFSEDDLNDLTLDSDEDITSSATQIEPTFYNGLAIMLTAIKQALLEWWNYTVEHLTTENIQMFCLLIVSTYVILKVSFWLFFTCARTCKLRTIKNGIVKYDVPKTDPRLGDSFTPCIIEFGGRKLLGVKNTFTGEFCGHVEKSPLISFSPNNNKQTSSNDMQPEAAMTDSELRVVQSTRYKYIARVHDADDEFVGNAIRFRKNLYIMPYHVYEKFKYLSKDDKIAKVVPYTDVTDDYFRGLGPIEDFVIIDVPKDVSSALGVTTAKLQKLTKGPVSMAGYGKYNFNLSSGGVCDENVPGKLFQSYHTSSSDKGHSGSVICRAGHPVGMHIGYAGEPNKNILVDISVIDRIIQSHSPTRFLPHVFPESAEGSKKQPLHPYENKKYKNFEHSSGNYGIRKSGHIGRTYEYVDVDHDDHWDDADEDPRDLASYIGWTESFSNILFKKESAEPAKVKTKQHFQTSPDTDTTPIRRGSTTSTPEANEETCSASENVLEQENSQLREELLNQKSQLSALQSRIDAIQKEQRDTVSKHSASTQDTKKPQSQAPQNSKKNSQKKKGKNSN